MDSRSRAEFPGESSPSQWVYFTCPDCRARLARPVRAEPDEPLRCFGCETALTWRISDTLLSQVFGEQAR